MRNVNFFTIYGSFENSNVLLIKRDKKLAAVIGRKTNFFDEQTLDFNEKFKRSLQFIDYFLAFVISLINIAFQGQTIRRRCVK